MQDVFKELLRIKGASIADVSKGAGIPYSTLREWAKGKTKKISQENLIKIAEYLGVVPWIFYGTVDEIPLYLQQRPMFEVAAGQGRINDGYGEPMKACDGQTAKVVGDSMYPVLLDGDIVRFVESTDVTPSDLALVRIDGEAVTVKYVEWTDDGMWVRAENKDVFEDKFFTVKEIATIPVQIAGKAVEIISRKL